MVASGSITIDVEAIRELVAPGSHSTQFRQWPWSAPTSDTTLARALSEYDQLPSEVVELFSITESFTAGYFQLELPLQDVLDYAATLTELAFDMVGEPPTGNLFWLSENDPPRSAVEVGGSCHGRLLSADPQIGWRTIAWSLSDAIACTRELYEADWYQWDRNPCYNTQDRKVVRARQEKMYPVLKPIIDRWNCSPYIAQFDDSFYHEPDRPRTRR
ncbi:MAG: hypothetical protein ACI81L_001139 [Verrucomicrobiales bacterium]|jgi:hypothetical protein